MNNKPSDPPAFEPYIPASSKLSELRALPIIVGTVLGMIFGASSLYLVLKVGLTVSASIPVAVISIALFRVLSKFGMRDATILENNIVQTAGSAGESIAFGVGVTMPAILILGFDLEVTRVILVSVLGALLGILMMIPLRRALIVQQHGILKYPEGTACAEVLKAGASPESQAAAAEGTGRDVSALAATATTGAKTIFTGFALGVIYNFAMKALHGWKDTPEKVFKAPLAGGSVACEVTPELLGVGYVIGPRIAAVMAAGGVLSYLLLIPLIKFFGEGLAGPLAPGTALIRDMSPNQIRAEYVLYIGAGAVAAGGIISLVRSIPLIWNSIRAGLRDFSGKKADTESVPRTDRDLPMKFVFIGIAALLAAILFAPTLHMNLIGAVMIILCGFLFVTVSSRLTGEIGSSSNPISGMTIATLLLTCLAFLALGWTDRMYYITALSVGGIVCIASSNGGTTSQDLKTGFLVGSTPGHQQIAILIGALASALVLGPILLKLNDTGKVYVPVTTEIRTDVSKLTEKSSLTGPQAKSDSKSYFLWHQDDEAGGTSKQYLVDDTGKAVYLVDPGINGTVTQRPDGSQVQKFDAPKATLVSYIIKGILSHKLPWALVLFGVMIAIVLEMSGIPSLAFAVGVYLPLATSMPVFIGGLVRWMVDGKRRKHPDYAHMTEEEHVAEGDRSPGVLMASGYIAGGAIAGIAIAFMAGVLSETYDKLDKWASAHNPFYAQLTPTQISPDILALIPFAIMVGILYLTGRGRILAGPKVKI
ncbi:MAG: oligopeptide transporter protein [Verrucomicrobiales bacterium]|nr:oligopeptide transporter protein [Verrucomicrobiales bacterium]